MFVILDVLRDLMSVVLPAAVAELLILVGFMVVAAAASAAVMVAPRPRSRGLAVVTEAIAATLVLLLSSGPIISTWWWGRNVLHVETVALDALRDWLAPSAGHLSALFTALGVMVVMAGLGFYLWKFAPEKTDLFWERFERGMIGILSVSLVSMGLYALWWLHTSGPGRLSDPGNLQSAVLGVAVVWSLGLVIALLLTLVGWIVETNVGRLRVAIVATAVVAVLVVIFLGTDVLPHAWKRDTVVMLLASLVGAWVWLFHGLGPSRLPRLGFGPRHRTPE